MLRWQRNSGWVLDKEGGGDGGGGGGADLAAAARAKAAGGEGDKGAGDGGGDKGKDPALGGPYYPEGMDVKFRGPSERETIDLLHKHINGLPRAPGKAEEYALTVGDKLKGLIDPANDKVLPIYRAVAHKHGLTQAQFEGVVNDLYGGILEGGFMPAPVDVAKEFARLGGEAGDTASRVTKGEQRVLAVVDVLNGLATRGDLTKEQAEDLHGVMSNATRTIAFERLLALLPKQAGPQAGGSPGATSAKSRAEVETMMSDPRYIYNSGKFEQKFYDEVNRLFEQVA